MDWWILKQLRAFVLNDVREFFDETEFKDVPVNLTLPPQITNHQHFSRELQWAHAASRIGKRLFFSPPIAMTARQISASDVLMNLGLLTGAQTMHGVLKQICNDAAKRRVPAGNAGEVQKQLENEHIPIFLENLTGALSQYFHHLTEAEKAPFSILLVPSAPMTVVKDDEMSLPVDIKTHHFDVAFSFPGEVRELVEQVANHLQKRLGKNSFFYDNNYVSQLARPSLDLLLQDIYRNRATLIVVFISEDYEKKNWCGIEFRAIREIILQKEDKVMFVRAGKGAVSGVFQIDGYIDAERFSPADIAKFIHERVLLAKMPS